MCYHKYLPRRYLRMLYTTELSNTWAVERREPHRLSGLGECMVGFQQATQERSGTSVWLWGLVFVINWIEASKVMSTRNLRIRPFWGVFEDVIRNVAMRSSGWALKTMASFPERQKETGCRDSKWKPHEDEGGDWSFETPKQRNAKDCWWPSAARTEAWKPPPEPPGYPSLPHLSLDFWEIINSRS